MNKWDRCVHDVAMDAFCTRCPREGRVVLTMNLITGYMSRWMFPWRVEHDQPSQTARAPLAQQPE